jgi:hypothetical protein
MSFLHRQEKRRNPFHDTFARLQRGWRCRRCYCWFINDTNHCKDEGEPISLKFFFNNIHLVIIYIIVKYTLISLQTVYE